MGGAVIVALVGYRLVLRRVRPVHGPVFDISTNSPIDSKLIGGAAAFGIGWGIAGFCPGGDSPALGMPDACLKDMGLTLHISGVTGPVMDRLSRSSFPAHLTDRVFLSRHDAYHDLPDRQAAHSAV